MQVDDKPTGSHTRAPQPVPVTTIGHLGPHPAARDQGGDGTSLRESQLRTAAKDALDEASRAAAKALAAERELAAIVATAEARQDEAKFNQEKAVIAAKILAAEQEAERAVIEIAAAKKREAEAAKIKALSEEARAANERGDFAGQDKAVAEIQKIRREQAADKVSTQAALDSIGTAAAAIPAGAPISTEKAVGGIIQLGNRIIEYRNGTAREIGRLDEAIKQLNIRLENQAAKS